ncbi:hypothetical protein DSO57_1014957 [Entomophthora muscae]|uniref:Uncharacterized protein n=1 Tax=Entomophthora muscae TaxID=34485 RepID=A0ACC2TG43_9FUNG|nr:hypothetical protein DSO57_1014957 [Entomophthora muscae]
MAGKETKQMSVGQFLVLRLFQIGVLDVFGVPGDFNMEFLDLVEDFKGVEWIGCCNELNASYAADGYARVRGMGCLVTTFGVGELSALNGHAGAYSEMVRVVHIVGSPSTDYRNGRALLHHTLGDGDFSRFQRMFNEISASTALLTKRTAAEAIDRALMKCWNEARPVYLSLPTDVSREMIEVDMTPLELKQPQTDVQAQEEAAGKILEALSKAAYPVLIADACVLRYGCVDEVRAFVKTSGMPAVASPMGKGVLDETHPQYQGVYLGSCTRYDSTRALMESADLIISLGAVKSDFNMGGFSYQLGRSTTIEMHSDQVRVFNAIYPQVGMKTLLPKLTSKVSKFNHCPNAPTIPKKLDTDYISHDLLWPKINSFIQPGDIVVCDMGTSCFGILDVDFPPDTLCILQLLWGSIGYSVGSALGAAMAAKHHSQRVLLFVGDGSFQVACQELSTLGRHKANICVFILNNGGYTIERVIHGKDRSYNSIQNWDYAGSARYFGFDATSKRVTSPTELDVELSNIKESGHHFHVLEVVMDREDTPSTLQAQAKLTAKANYA